MRIADEIDHVMREFVACEDLFLALCEEQELELYQIASWMQRNEKALERVQMVECNHELRDFRLLTDGWIGDVLFSIRLGDDPGWDGDVGPGFRAGWLKPELRGFFKTTQVDFPEVALASRRLNPPVVAKPPATDVENETLEARDEGEEKVLGTRERTTLLTIIAALAEEAKISLVTPSKSAELIASVSERMGAPVAKRTIEEHLKKVTDALERRSR